LLPENPVSSGLSQRAIRARKLFTAQGLHGAGFWFANKSEIFRWHVPCVVGVNQRQRCGVAVESNNNQISKTMKLNRIITLCAMALTLAVSAGSLLAQDNGNNNGGPGGNQQGGQRRNRQGGGNFDPAQMQQRMLERVQEQLGFTNDTEWDAVKPLVQKVMDARRDVGFGGMGRMFGGGRNRGGDQGGNARPNPFGQTSPEQEALQKAIDDDAPAAQIKDWLAKYKASQKAKQTKLEAAQAELKAVLTTKQEAQAYLLQLVN
jgi:hypothetical protein